MTILVALVLLCMPYGFTRLLTGRRARAPHALPVPVIAAQAPSEPKTVMVTVTDLAPGWSSLDERQLTRLLASAAPPAPPTGQSRA